MYLTVYEIECEWCAIAVRIFEAWENALLNKILVLRVSTWDEPLQNLNISIAFDISKKYSQFAHKG